jgi:hypothetical protein
MSFRDKVSGIGDKNRIVGKCCDVIDSCLHFPHPVTRDIPISIPERDGRISRLGSRSVTYTSIHYDGMQYYINEMKSTFSEGTQQKKRKIFPRQFDFYATQILHAN